MKAVTLEHLITEDEDDEFYTYTRGPGCWPLIVIVVLAWSILGWLAYLAWLLFGNPVPIL